jgi:DNA-binding transcriptional regulator YiaG
MRRDRRFQNYWMITKNVLDKLYSNIYSSGVMKSLIEQLEEYRLENRVSQVGLAKILGVTHATVSRWLNGHSQPNKIQTFHIRKLLATRGKKK